MYEHYASVYECIQNGVLLNINNVNMQMAWLINNGICTGRECLRPRRQACQQQSLGAHAVTLVGYGVEGSTPYWSDYYQPILLRNEQIILYVPDSTNVAQIMTIQ